MIPPFQIEDIPPPLPPAAAAGPPPTTSFLTSCMFLFILFFVLIVGVASMVTLSVMKWGKHHHHPVPLTLSFTLDDFKVIKLDTNSSALTVTYHFVIRISVKKSDESCWYNLSNPIVVVIIGDVASVKSFLPPLTVKTPKKAEWSLNTHETLIPGIDQTKLIHLKELVDGVYPVPFTVIIIGEDFQHRAFNASCPATIFVYDSQPPILSSCTTIPS